MSIKVVSSKRGSGIVVEKHKYVKHSTRKSGEIVWRCVRRKECGATLNTNREVTCVLKYGKDHSHEPLTATELELEEIRHAVKRKATEDLTVRPNKLIRAVCDSEDITLKDLRNLRQTIYRKRIQQTVGDYGGEMIEPPPNTMIGMPLKENLKEIQVPRTPERVFLQRGVQQTEDDYGGEMIEPSPNTMIGVPLKVEFEETRVPTTPERVIGVPLKVEFEEIQVPRTPEREISEAIIHPVTEKYIINYESNPSHVIDETPELYTFVTLPHLNEEPFNLQWVYNIIDGTAEKDRVIFQTPSKDDKNGFLLIPDLKWDGVTLDNLHLLALPYRPGILSLRDLRENHLPLLKNIYIQGRKAIKERYGLVGSRLRIFLHYQPSFYHLHVHFTSVSYEAFGINVGKAHLLASVISSIEVCPNYYQEATLPFILRESDNLFLKFEEHGIIEKLEMSDNEG